MLTFQYLLESAFCLTCLYALYWFALRRETFFQWNRAYLVLAPVVAFALPALHIQIEQAKPEPAPATAFSAPPVFDLPVLVEHARVAPRSVSQALEQPVSSLTLGEILWWIYLAGAWVFLLHLAVQVYRLLHFLRRCQWSKQGDIVLATGPENSPLASFFGFVFWHPGDTDEGERRLLLEHEMVHVRQWHSLDLILMEILLALQWFNPLLYAYRRSLRAVHEYIADENVVRRTRQRHSYARLLLSWQATGNGAQPGLVNTFHSLIKNRLIMLAKHPSNPLRRAKYLLTLPLFGALLLLFSFRLVEHLPAAKPLRAALQTAENYAARLGEVTVTAPTAMVAEPTPYIFYWGLLQAKFFQEGPNGRCFAEITTSAKDFRKSIDREPRLWNGQTLEQHMSFSIENLDVHSDYYAPEVYDGYRKKLLDMVSELPESLVLNLEGIPLPNGKTGSLRLVFDDNATTDTPAKSDAWVKTPVISHTAWGEKNLPFGEHSFITIDQFWKLIHENPTLYYLEGGSVNPQKWSFRINRKGSLIVPPAAGIKNALSFQQLREQLEQMRETLTPETQITLSAWDAFNITRDKASIDTIVTFDPETYTESLQLIHRETGSAIEYSSWGVIFHIVSENDPRLALRKNDKIDYRFEWSPLYTVSMLQRYAVSYAINGSPELVYADNAIESFSHLLTVQDILKMIRQPANLFRDNKPLEHFEFMLLYNNQKFVILDGKPNNSVVQYLEKNLKPQDQLVLSGLHSGSIDLGNVTLNIEVRSDDPKPALRPSTASPSETGISLNVSPNPAHEQATLDIQIPKAGAGLLTVTDAAGAVLYSLKTDFQAGKTPFRLPLAQIKSKGLLVVRLDLPYGSGSTKMVVE